MAPGHRVRSQPTKARVLENPGDPWDLRRLSAESGLHSHQFRALCIAQHGESPVKVPTRIRMERARQLLMQTGLPLDQIAWLAGYHEASAFSEVFLRHFGTRPGALRSRIPHGSGSLRETVKPR